MADRASASRVPLRTRTRHLIGGGRLPVAPGIAAVDQAWDETAGAERRSHTEQHGRDCRSGPRCSTSRGRRRPDRLIGSGASRDPDGSKHKSSSLAGIARTAEFGHMQSRIIAAERTHGPMLQVWTARGAAGRANPQKWHLDARRLAASDGPMQQWEMRSVRFRIHEHGAVWPSRFSPLRTSALDLRPAEAEASGSWPGRRQSHRGSDPTNVRSHKMLMRAPAIVEPAREPAAMLQ